MIYSAKESNEAAITELFAPVTGYITDPAVQEVLGTWDPVASLCRLCIDYGTGPLQAVAATLTPEAIITATLLLATEAGKSLDAQAPLLNCMLPSGCRYHAALPPVADGPSVNFRTHYLRKWELTHFGITPGQISLIKKAIRDQQTILISGKTISGKTSFANAILALIPPELHVLVIEDEIELQVDKTGRIISRRRATKEASFEVQVAAALRARPDYLILGEVRGGEAADVLEAASSGHPGITTIHAGSVDEALARLQRLARCDRELVHQAIDMVVQLVKQPDGRRVVTEIKELR